MSCWVVPSIAAEMWGVSLNQVAARIASGSVATRLENGWTFIDIAPDSPQMVAGPAIKPPTFTILTPEESEALNAESAPEETGPTASIESEEPAPSAHDDEEAESPDLTWQNWHRVRQEVGRTRRRPPMAA